MTSATAAKVTPLQAQDTDWSDPTVIATNHGEPLRACVRTAVRTYLHNMDGQDVAGLHRLVMDEVERPLIETVLEAAGNNQSVAARMLSISRSTLRKKLAAYATADTGAES